MSKNNLFSSKNSKKSFIKRCHLIKVSSPFLMFVKTCLESSKNHTTAFIS